ncbi:MAG: hypothetical protein K0U29_00910 [Gammaproteobacteria bacterium]|nr:hypothetical protein [Gammaproteobacteria bacterium]MCH9743466.1 hypothetical protein [Gammaproteobacteria bacterium]
MLKDKFQNSDVVWYTNEYWLMSLTLRQKLKYFYEPSKSTGEHREAIHYLVDHWHRDQDGIDMTFENNISQAQVISQSLRLAFSNIYRNYLAIVNCLKLVDLLYIYDGETEYLKKPAKYFHEKIRWYTSKSQKETNFLLASSPARTRFERHPEIHRLSKVARVVQKFFINMCKRKRRTLVISDWTYAKIMKKNSNVLVLNCLCPWKGYYFKLPENIENVFPSSPDSSLLSSERLNNILEQKNILWDEALIELFSSEILDRYNEACSHVNRAYAIFSELLDYYEPDNIVVPYETHFAYVTLLYLARSRNIRTYLCVDGSYIIQDDYWFYKDQNNKSYLFDYFFAFGQVTVDYFINQGISEAQVLKIKSPLLSYFSPKKQPQELFDAIVMYPVQTVVNNPEGREDYSIQYVKEVLECLVSLGHDRIGLKMKSNLFNESMREFLKNYFGELFLKVEMLTGRTYEFINETSMVIGYIGTAIFETIYAGKAYYIYEPVENGADDEHVYSSLFINSSAIARSVLELKNNIVSGNKVKADFNYLFDGAKISDYEFS